MGGFGRLILGVGLGVGLGARFADYLLVGFDWAQEPSVPDCQPPAAVYLDHVLVKSRHLHNCACVVPPQGDSM